MLSTLWEKERDKLSILFLGWPSLPTSVPSDWPLFHIESWRFGCFYSAQCFHEVFAIDPQNREKVRRFLVESVKFMPNTYPCLMVPGWQSPVGSEFESTCPSPPLWVEDHPISVFRFYFFLDGNRSESQSSLSPFAERSDATPVTWHRGARPVMQTALPCVLHKERLGAHTGGSTDLWFSDLDPSPQEEPWFLTLCFSLFYSHAFLTAGFIHCDWNTNYGENLLKLLWLTFSIRFGRVVDTYFASAT